MNPLSALYGLGVAARNASYDRGWLKAQRLSWPVVSVGNLSVGGSGKTPFVILLGQLLRRQGYFITVLSRGYGREAEAKTVELVDSSGEPARYGDEPLLITRKLNAPVFVGAERYQCGLLAEEKFAEPREPGHIPRAVHILDDGFQHRRLARSFDIVLLPPEDLSGSLLPTGRLREGLRSLKRANAVILTSGAQRESLPEFAREKAFILERSLVIKNAPHQNAPKHPVAFCGIAKPARFLEELKSLGMQPRTHVPFRDHHRYSADDIALLLDRKKSSGADGFITTEKDLINLGESAAKLAPLAIAELRMRLVEEPRFTQFIEAVLQKDFRGINL